MKRPGYTYIQIWNTKILLSPHYYYYCSLLVFWVVQWIWQIPITATVRVGGHYRPKIWNTTVVIIFDFFITKYLLYIYLSHADLADADHGDFIHLGVVVTVICAISFLFAFFVYWWKGIEPYSTILCTGQLHFWIIFSTIIAYVYDVASDIFLAMQYYKENNYTYFWMTAAFIVAPALFTYFGAIALLTSKTDELTKLKWCLSIFALVLFGFIVAIPVHLFM